MNTAVQLRAAPPDGRGPRCEIVHGTPHATVAGRLGPVALFSSGEIVAYLLRGGRRPHLFVFRTLDVDDRLAAVVPGVQPRVQLLLELRTAGRARLATRLFAYLVKRDRPPSRLPDAFFLRVGVALAGRLPAHKVLLGLLPSTEGGAERWTR